MKTAIDRELRTDASEVRTGDSDCRAWSSPGGRDFDRRIVDALHRRDPAAVNPTSGGGLRCPFAGHDHRLAWEAGDHRRGPEPHGEPALRSRVAGVDAGGEPELILWRRRIGLDRTGPCPEIQRALDRLEPQQGQQTEPDVVLHVPGRVWIFIEAKLSSPTATYAGRAGKLAGWRERYAVPTPGLFDDAALDAAVPKSFPEQSRRRVALANAVRAGGERAVVVALVRAQYAPVVEGWAGGDLAAEARVDAVSATSERYTRRSRRLMGAWRHCAATWRTRAWGCAESSPSREGRSLTLTLAGCAPSVPHVVVRRMSSPGQGARVPCLGAAGVPEPSQPTPRMPLSLQPGMLEVEGAGGVCLRQERRLWPRRLA